LAAIESRLRVHVFKGDLIVGLFAQRILIGVRAKFEEVFVRRALENRALFVGVRVEIFDDLREQQAAFVFAHLFAHHQFRHFCRRFPVNVAHLVSALIAANGVQFIAGAHASAPAYSTYH